MSKFGTIGRTGSAMGPPKFGAGGPEAKKKCYIFQTSIEIQASYNRMTKELPPGGPMENNFKSSFQFAMYHHLRHVDIVNCKTHPELCKSECVFSDDYNEIAGGCDPVYPKDMELDEFVHPSKGNGPLDKPTKSCYDSGKNPAGVLYVHGYGTVGCHKQGLVCLTDEERDEILYWPWEDSGDGGHWNFIIRGETLMIPDPGGKVNIIMPQKGGHPDLVTSVTWDLLKFMGETQPKYSNGIKKANCPPICCLAKQTLLGPMKGQSTKPKELPDSPHNQMVLHKFHALMNMPKKTGSGGVYHCKSVYPDTTGSDHPKLEAECKCGGG